MKNKVKLSLEQEEAVQRILNCKDEAIILTGRAGSGKSTIVKHLIENHRKLFGVCATTGRAAILIGGCTVDRLFSINRENWKIRDYYKQKIELQKRGRFIIIDEASMIGQNMANLLYRAAKKYHKTLVLVGDWAQASPVKEEWPFNTPLFKNREIIHLKENHRQDEKEFYNALDQIRMGKINDDSQSLLKSRLVSEEVEEDDKKILLTGTNRLADYYNEESLQEHIKQTGNPKVVLKSYVEDKRKGKLKSRFPLSERSKKNFIKDSRLGHDVSISLGCRVICTWNNSDLSIVNGDTGYLEDVIFYQGTERRNWSKNPKQNISFKQIAELVIRLDRTGGTARLGKKTVPIPNMDNVNVKGFPIFLGYALTIHKSQGMTIPQIWVDLKSILDFRTKESRHGLAYVALSRVSKLNGLFLGSWDKDCIHCCPEVEHMVEQEN